MSEHFLKDINIIEYKCFNNFEVKDLKRVNLISGKNNVGKTAFMEALDINIHSIDSDYFSFFLYQRAWGRDHSEKTSISEKEVIEYISQYKKVNIQTNIGNSFFSFETSLGIKKFIFNDLEIPLSNFVVGSKKIDNTSFFDKNSLSYKVIIRIFSYIQNKNKEEFLNKLINQFDESIQSFKIINGIPQCQTVDGVFRNLNEFGDGLKHFISIICALHSCEEGYIFIDEIDNGIHYTQLDKLWKIIFEISKEVNCQVFATTHSKEMIEAFNRQDDGDGGFFELYKNLKKNELAYKFRDKEQLEYSLHNNGEFRG